MSTLKRADSLAITNAMTVDVEDYFQVSAFERHIKRQDWEHLSPRVEHNTQRILDVFQQHQISATFFILGWVAERFPQLLQRMVAEGHEVACHGYEHIRVTEQTPEQFRQDIRRSKQLLEDMSGHVVKGYRAASYSINKQNLWAHEVLYDEGFAYSSSVYPVKHDLYGIPDAPRFVYQPLKQADFKEIPVTTLRIGQKNFPCGGGGFFRFYPYALSRWALSRVNRNEGQTAIFYFHPWEIDPQQPRQTGLNFKTRFRHYLNLSRMEPRILSLLRDFQWDRMDRLFLE